MAFTRFHAALLAILGMIIVSIIIWQQEQGRQQRRTQAVTRSLLRQVEALELENRRLRAALARSDRRAFADQCSTPQQETPLQKSD